MHIKESFKGKTLWMMSKYICLTKIFVVHCATFHVDLRALKHPSSLIKADLIKTVTFRSHTSIFPSPGQDRDKETPATFWLFCHFITTVYQASVTCHKLAMQGCIRGHMFCHRFSMKSQKMFAAGKKWGKTIQRTISRGGSWKDRRVKKIMGPDGRAERVKREIRYSGTKTPGGKQ